jgi:hypothetical protein
MVIEPNTIDIDLLCTHLIIKKEERKKNQRICLFMIDLDYIHTEEKNIFVSYNYSLP